MSVAYNRACGAVAPGLKGALAIVKKFLNLKPPISITNNDFNVQISKFRMAQLPARLAGRVV